MSIQNCGKDKGYGARTGEISADMILDFGLKWTITGDGSDRGLFLISISRINSSCLGHSERRVGFGEGGESSKLVAEKTKVSEMLLFGPTQSSVVVLIPPSDCPGCWTFCDCLHW